MLEGIELGWLRLVEVAFLGPVQSWCAEGKVAFLTDLLNDNGFNPSSVTRHVLYPFLGKDEEDSFC